jgi:hypothetical protein
VLVFFVQPGKQLPAQGSQYPEIIIQRRKELNRGSRAGAQQRAKTP